MPVLYRRLHGGSLVPERTRMRASGRPLSQSPAFAAKGPKRD
ncbi:hypothetical protein [Azospirillum argentinense]